MASLSSSSLLNLHSSSSSTLTTSDPLSPLFQLRQWTSSSTLSSEPLIIVGGIPKVTLRVQFPGFSERYLQIRRTIIERDDFLLFLAEEADMDSYEIEKMLETGMIWGVIEPIDTNPKTKAETEEFFKDFVYRPDDFVVPPPSYVKPVSAEKIDAFRSRCPSKFDEEEPWVPEGGIPPVTLCVQFPGYSEKYLQIPRHMEERGELLLFLGDNTPMPSAAKESMHRTGISHITVKPMEKDPATLDFFKDLLRNPVKPTPLIIPQITISVKFLPYSEKLIVRIPSDIRSHEKLMEFLGNIAIRMKMPSHIKDYMFKSSEIQAHLELIDKDPRSSRFFKRLTDEKSFLLIPIPSQPIKTPNMALTSIPSASHSSTFFSVSTSSLSSHLSTRVVSRPFVNSQLVRMHRDPLSTRVVSKPSVNSQLVRMHKDPLSARMVSRPTLDIQLPRIHIDPSINEDLPQARFQMIIENDIKNPHSLRVPPKISSLHKFEMFIKESLAKQGRGVGSNFSIRSESTIDTDDKLRKIFSHSPVVLYVSGTAELAVSSPSQLDAEPPQLVNFQMVIDNKINAPHLLQVSAKIINSLHKFEMFIKESLAKQGIGVEPKFHLLGKGNAIRTDDNLREIFSTSPVVLHIFGTKKLAISSTSQSSSYDLASNAALKVLPPRSINIALPWTFSADHWDFSSYYHTVQIAHGIRSLEQFKRFLQAKLPTLLAANFADFDVMYMMDNTWTRLDNTSNLMACFKQIAKDSIPFFACVERKLPQPDLRQQPPAPRQPEPMPTSQGELSNSYPAESEGIEGHLWMRDRWLKRQHHPGVIREETKILMKLRKKDKLTVQESNLFHSLRSRQTIIRQEEIYLKD